MPVWQQIYDAMKDKGFVVVAVAMDTAEAARPYVDAAKPAYPCLVDRDHRVAALYGMVNVPEAVWIDENGRIARPAENAGSWDGFRRRDRTTGIMPKEDVDLIVRAKRTYMDAVRDWAINGAASRHVFNEEAARARLRPPSEDVALAHVHFRLGGHLLRTGRPDEALTHFEEARRLHPDSWTIWRQTAGRNDQGFAANADFWARVDALGESRYYPRVDMEGMP